MIRKLIAAFAALLPLMGQAEILQLNYTNPDGVAVSRAPSQVYHNPASQISFAVSAGLDRMVRLTVLDSAGAVVHVQTSKLIGATDRITVDSKSYYGVNSTAPEIGEGSYRLKEEIIDINGVVVQKNEYPLVVDVTKPTLVGDITRGLSYESVAVVARNGYAESENGNFYVPESADSNGISHAKFFAIADAGAGVRREGNASLDQTGGRVSVLFSELLHDSIMPHNRHEYMVGFDVYDRAGNKSTIFRITAKDETLPPIITQVYNPINQQWIDYSSGMTVYQNPIVVRFKISKADTIAFNGTNYGYRNG